MAYATTIRIGWVLACMLGLGISARAVEPPGPDWIPQIVSQAEAAEGFYPLFDGSSFDGWTIRGANKKAFAARDGLLITTGEGGGDWIFTTRPYTNFVLRYAYRVFKQDDNSGVAIRATADGNPAFTGMEIQVLHPVEHPNVGSAGALYASVAPAVAADKPFEQWNDVEILCDGTRVRTTMNGQQLYDVDIAAYPWTDKKNPPLGERAKSGFIAIQDYGKYVEFRNPRIKPLPGGEGWRRLEAADCLPLGDAMPACGPDGVVRLAGTGMRTRETFRNAELRLHFKAQRGARGRVIVRGQGTSSEHGGCAVRIDNHNPESFTGTLEGAVNAVSLRAMDGCWCEVHVVAREFNVQVAVNGKTVVDYIDPKLGRTIQGWAGIESLDRENAIEVKDIEIKPIAGP